MALGDALLFEQQTCFLAKVANHHPFVAWLIEREVVAVLRGNLLNLHALLQISHRAWHRVTSNKSPVILGLNA